MDSTGGFKCCNAPTTTATTSATPTATTVAAQDSESACVSVSNVNAPLPGTTTSLGTVPRAARTNVSSARTTTTTTTVAASASSTGSRLAATATNQGAVPRASRASRQAEQTQLLRSASLSTSRSADFDANRYSSSNIDLSAAASATRKQADGEASNTLSSPPNGLNGFSDNSLRQLSAFMASEFERNNQSILSRIDSLAAQISVITERTEPFAQLSAQINDIEARVANLENNSEGAAAALPPANVNINDLASELQDRFFRARNLFLYGIIADNNNPQHDIQQVTHMLSNIPGINLNGLTVHRIPSRRQNEPGPIVARLPAQDEVVRVLRNRRLLPPGITPRADRTEAERAQLRSLAIEIEEHNAANPNDKKRIVYVRGAPTAVSVKKNHRPRKN